MYRLYGAVRKIMVSKDKVCKLIFEIRVYNLVLAYLSAAHLLIPTHALVAFRRLQCSWKITSDNSHLFEYYFGLQPKAKQT